MADKAVDENEVICTNADYNEVPCDDTSAAWRLSRKEAKARKDVLNAPVPSTVPEPEPAPEAPVEAADEEGDDDEIAFGKAQAAPPANKAKNGAASK
jgi:hypothetical protein